MNKGANEMYIVYNRKTNETIARFVNMSDAMLEANKQNDRYAINLVRSGKAPNEFAGIYSFKEEK